eukprot:08144.XXX_17850_18458_1 [CDS] Oithona nana genome sequencing.
MNLRWYAFLVLLLTLWGVSTKDVEQNRALRPIEITKVTKWTDAENVVGFTLTLLASQFIIASGWIIFGSIWYAMAVNTSENSDTHKTIMLFESMFGPDFVIGNLYRCFAVSSFLALAMLIKTVFTIGMSNTAQIFGSTDSSDAYGMVTSDGFLKGTLIRAFFNSFFLIVGWGLVA